jgi:hypothetical protein
LAYNYKHTGAENALAGLASQRLQAASAAITWTPPHYPASKCHTDGVETNSHK